MVDACDIQSIGHDRQGKSRVDDPEMTTLDPKVITHKGLQGRGAHVTTHWKPIMAYTITAKTMACTSRKGHSTSPCASAKGSLAYMPA